MVIADFVKEQEELWYPVLERHGFYDLQLEEGTMDLEEAVDATAKHETSGDDVLRIALRTRNVTNYTLQQLSEYKRQFTIRRSRPTGALTEWDKVFSANIVQVEDMPRLMGYGWMRPDGSEIEYYVILSVKVLRDLYASGQLENCIRFKGRNKDWRKSEFVAISLDCAQAASDGAAVVYRSENHPGLTDKRQSIPSQ